MIVARARGQAGMSMLEVLVTLILAFVIFSILYELVFAATQVGMLTEGLNDLSTLGQRAVNTIQTDVRQAKLVFQEDAIGTSYRTLFTSALPPGMTVWTGSRMPILDANTTVIGPDPGPNNITNRTGNSIIVVRQLSPIAIPYDHDANAATPNINFMADRYQFDYYFIRQDTTRKFGTLNYALDLMQAKSQIVADYYELNGVTVNRAQILTGLRAQSPAITLAWDPGKALAAPAFYNVNAAGTLTSNTTPVFTVTVASLLPEFKGGRVTGAMNYSVGLNYNAATFKVNDVSPAYATANSNFPGGFETMAVGPLSSRKVLARLVLAVESRRQLRSQESLVITSAHGF